MFKIIMGFLLAVLCCTTLITLLYIITAKRFEDRIVGANLVGTIVINIIALFAAFTGEGYIVDVCIMFAFLSFLGVIVLCRLLAVRFIETTVTQKDIDAFHAQEGVEGE